MMSKEYAQSVDYTVKTMVSNVGRQPNSNMWVSSDSLQIDHRGYTIPPEDQMFYWHASAVAKTPLTPVPISLPLQLDPLSHLFKTTRECLGVNYISSLLTFTGGIISFHYESILDLQDECPLFLCYSSNSGTGKSFSLLNTLSVFGVADLNTYGPDTNPVAVIMKAANTTLPLGIDDIRSAKKLETIAVQFFNGFSHSTVSNGIQTPRTSMIVTSNQPLCDTERSSQRIVHIPFFHQPKPFSPSEQARTEMILKEARSGASAAIGEIIKLGGKLISPEVQLHLQNHHLPFVIQHMPSLHFRVQKCYALALTTAELLSDLMPDVVAFNEVQEFFVEKWAPHVVGLHSCGGGILSTFFNFRVCVELLKEILACPVPLYWDCARRSCVVQCPLFSFGNHSTGQCQPIPNAFDRGIQTDATAYFGRKEINATFGSRIFRFRIVIDLSTFNGINAIVVIMARNSIVERIFKFSDGQNQRTFAIADNGGIDAVNASRVCPEIRLIEIMMPQSRYVIYEDCVVYHEAPPSDFQVPVTLDFDINLVVIGQDSIAQEFSPFITGTVKVTPPVDFCQNDGTCTNIAPMVAIPSCSSDIDMHAISDDECDQYLSCQNDGLCMNKISESYTNTSIHSCFPSQPCRKKLTCSRGIYNCNCLCIAQCPLFTFGNHSMGYCQPFLGNYGGVQANATAYFGSIHTNAANGTVVFQFRVFIDLGHFNNDIQFINVTLIQNNFAEKIFTFSNHQHKQNFSIGKHGGIDAVNVSRVFPEITLLQNRFLVYEDYVIYSYEDDFPLSTMQLPTSIDLDLDLVVLGQNSVNTEEHSPFAIAIIELIKDISQGIATRHYENNGQWREVDVSECTSTIFLELKYQAENLLNSQEEMSQSASMELIQQLIEATQPQKQSLLPNDLQATSRVLSIMVQVLNNNNITNEDIIDVIDNVLHDSNMDGWEFLQSFGKMDASELLLQSTEQYAALVTVLANKIEEQDEVQEFQIAYQQSRQNIAIMGKQYSRPPTADLAFPDPSDVVNYTLNRTSRVSIPQSLIKKKFEEGAESLPVSFILLRNIPLSASSVRKISNTFIQRTNGCIESGQQLVRMSDSEQALIASDLVTVVVGRIQETNSNSLSLQRDPLSLNFTFESVVNDTITQYHCVYWNFSYPVGNGSWISDGVTTNDVDVTEGNTTMVQCTSTHLTSFAVLVNVAGGLGANERVEHTALQIVSYIGCVISIICLVITIVFFIWRGNLFNSKSTHFFVHLNLTISLLLATLVFVLGIETTSGNTIGCAFVAALLHYLFLSSFCWMLCEGIMLYLLLHVVFSDVAKKWWLFMLIGYVTPLPIVTVTVGVRYQHYGVRDSCGKLLYCWLSIEHGTIFGFVAPMLAIILVNSVFLTLALIALWKNKKHSVEVAGEEKHSFRHAQELGKAVFIGSLVLLPLLGLTWIFGILTVNANSTVFAWLFTIFNSSQGMFIFLFHVIRSKEIRKKLKSKLSPSTTSTVSAKWQKTPQGGTATHSSASL